MARLDAIAKRIEMTSGWYLGSENAKEMWLADLVRLQEAFRKTLVGWCGSILGTRNEDYSRAVIDKRLAERCRAILGKNKGDSETQQKVSEVIRAYNVVKYLGGD